MGVKNLIFGGSKGYLHYRKSKEKFNISKKKEGQKQEWEREGGKERKKYWKRKKERERKTEKESEVEVERERQKRRRERDREKEREQVRTKLQMHNKPFKKYLSGTFISKVNTPFSYGVSTPPTISVNHKKEEKTTSTKGVWHMTLFLAWG